MASPPTSPDTSPTSCHEFTPTYIFVAVNPRPLVPRRGSVTLPWDRPAIASGPTTEPAAAPAPPAGDKLPELEDRAPTSVPPTGVAAPDVRPEPSPLLPSPVVAA